MKKISETTHCSIGQKAAREQALMLSIRFQLLLLKRHGGTRCQSRLGQAIKALRERLNLVGPSQWFEAQFIEQTGQFAGLWWFVSGPYGDYRVQVGDKPFSWMFEQQLLSA